MLAGFAFENAIKALFLRRGSTLYINGKLPKYFQSHSLTQWAKDALIQFESWEAEAPDKAEFFCVAWGRYPFHNKTEMERPFESWGWSDVEQIINLTGRVIEYAKKA